MSLKMQRIVLIFSLTTFVACILGCGAFFAKPLMDAATDNTIKMMEAQAKIEREKRQERYFIEGEVQKVEMREKQIDDPDPAQLQKTQEKTENGIKMSVRPGKKTLKYCVVIFSDGREKEFNSVPTSPLNGGVYYKIEYNGMQEVVSVTKIEKKEQK